MATRKIIWTHRAKIKLYQILEYFTSRNGNSVYSRKLYLRFKKELKPLLKYPNLGKFTEIEQIRGLIVDDYILFYSEEKEGILVHYVWDTRQDPSALKIKE